jgi:Flp pilus assembly protein TadD
MSVVQSDNLRRPWLVKLVLSLALVVLVLLVYWPSFRYPFLQFDDLHYIYINPHAQSGLTEENIRYAFTTGTGGNWHPLVWLSWQLDATLYGGENAGGFHRTNVLLHAASTLVLFLVLCRMTASTWRSAIVAALFALHPLNVESVAWISERKNTLSTLFWMLTLAAYLGYVRRPGLLRYLVVLAAFTLGLMSKAALVTLPCVLLLLDYWPLERWRRDPQAAAPLELPAASLRFLVLEKLPLFALVLAGGVVTYVVQERTYLVQSWEKFPLDVRVLNALQSYVIYGAKMLWPTHLAAFYPYPGKAVLVSAGLASAVLLAVVALLVLWPGRRHPYLAVGWLWYLGTLVPMIGLVQVGEQALADRYAYIPTIGLFLVLAWGGADLAERMQLSTAVRAVVVVVVVLLFSVLSRIQLSSWKSDKALWKHALDVTTDNAFAHSRLAMAYAVDGQFSRAEKEMKAAEAIDPTTPRFQYAYGNALLRLGRLEEALTAYRKARGGNFADPNYRALLADAIANVLRRLGRNEEALAEQQAALSLAWENPLFHCNLASLLLDLGRNPEAQAEYRQAIELDPTSDSPHVGLGRAFAALGRHEEACAEFRRAIELSPQNPLTHYNFAQILQTEGRLEEAGREYRQAGQLGMSQAASQWQACDQLSRLQPRLPGLLAGKDQPANNGERLGFAELCEQPFVRRYAQAAHLYAEAFGNDPALADDPRTGRRTAAAIAAARAGCGRGRDADALNDEARAKLRRQSLEWLQADLARWRQWAHQPQTRTILVQTLRDWQKNEGLAGVRESAALARLPAEERAAWQKMWQEIEALLAQKNASHG